LNKSILLQELAGEIRTIYSSDISGAETAIESYIGQRLNKYSPAERLGILEELAREFRPAGPAVLSMDVGGTDEVSRLFSSLLGEKISLSELSSAEVAEKMIDYLNTIFNTVNEIIRVINTTLSGKREQVETIRHIIGSDLRGAGGEGSLQEYLGQIKDAFLTAHQAFRQAARTKVNEILSELDPGHIASMTEGSLKFGPLKKAELYEIFTRKFEVLRNYFDSGRFMEGFAREFEKNCEKLYKSKPGRFHEKS
jgi:hypothetical protein